MAAGNSCTKSQGWNLITTLFAAAAFVLMWPASTRCNFVKFTSTGGSSESIVIQFGIWYYEHFAYVASPDGQYIVGTCTAYPDDTPIDPSWKAARAFSSFASFFASLILLLKLFQACSKARHSPDPYRRSGHEKVLPLLPLTGACQALTLLFLNSDACKDNPLVGIGDVRFEDECAISQGGWLDVGATALWLAAGAAALLERKAWEREREEWQREREERQQERQHERQQERRQEREERQQAAQTQADLEEPLNP